MSEPSRIILCQCAYAQVVPVAVRESVLQGLRGAGASFESVADLCELAARQDPVLKRMAAAGDLRIAACYPRAVKWLFAMGQALLPDGRARILNMRAQSADQVVTALLGPRLDSPSDPYPQDVPRPAAECNGTVETKPPKADRIVRAPSTASEGPEMAGMKPPAPPTAGWQAWFPVIDYDRCTHCAQCLSFCLFGVYGLRADRKVQVQDPARCKPNCPACARVCPEVAILFPKYKTGPINGDEVNLRDVEREKLKVDISALLGGDVHQVLRERGQARFSKERDAGTALQERRKYLAKLVELGDIPPEVLMSLPVPKEYMPPLPEAEGK